MSFVVIKIFAFESFTRYEIASIPNKGNIGMEIRPVLKQAKCEIIVSGFCPKRIITLSSFKKLFAKKKFANLLANISNS